MVWTRNHTIITSVAAGAMVLAVVAVFTLAPTGNSVARADGPAVNIEVVAPREPVPVDGGVMEVGELTDGYEHRPYAQPASYDPGPDGWLGDESMPMPEPRRWTSEPQQEEPPQAVVTVRAQGDPMRFGFDEPQPDYAAERRERRARREQREAENAARAMAPSGARLSGEAVFY